ncbi:MAG: hypothetical protein RLO08_18540 [Parvibaculaceae bacterium]
MIRKRMKNHASDGKRRCVPDRNAVYATLMINSEYTNRAGTGQTGKSPEGKNYV